MLTGCRQIRELQIATSQPLGYIAQYTITSVASLGIAFYYCWNLTLVIIATVPVTAFILAWISDKMQPSIRAQQEELSSASKMTMNAFSNIETVKCFNGQDLETSKYTQAVANAASHYLAQAKANALQIGFVRFVTLAMFVQGFWYGHYLVATGSKSTGIVVTTFWSCLTATQAVEQILPHMLVLEKGRAAGAALLNIIKESRTAVKPHLIDQPQMCRGEIEIHNVSFAYPARPKHPVLSQFIGNFQAGKTTFLIGKSGSGKSTLAQLLLRFYSATEGTITLDGRPLQTIDPQWLRRNITLVEQQNVLFRGTVADNISMGSSGDVPTSEDIKSAAQFALLQHTINDLPAGLETMVEAKGGSLSGGQRQRLALARGRLRNSEIVILDEPTSALDQTSRSLIMSALREWRKGRTTIIVSHDLSQIRDDDYVYILEDGRIEQRGYGSAFRVTKEPAPVILAQPPPGDHDRTSRYSSPMLAKAAKEKPDNPSSNATSMWVPPVHHQQIPIKMPYETRPYLEHTNSDPYDNILDEYMEEDIKISSRKSFIPSVFATAGATATSMPLMFGSSHHGLMQRNKHSARRSSATSQRSKHKGSDADPSSNRPRAETLDKSKRLSQNLMELIEITGKHAADNRFSAIRNRRRSTIARRLSSSESSTDKKESDTSETAQISMMRILRTVWPTLLSRSRMLLVAGFLSAVIHAVATPLFSWVFSRLLSTFYDPKNGPQGALKWSLSTIAIAVFDALACFFMHVLLEYCGQVWVDCIRRNAITRILDQPKQWFAEESNNAAQLVQSLDRDAEEMRNLLGRFAAFLLVALVMMSLAVVWSLAVCWKLTLVGLSIAPVSFAITRGFQAVSATMEGRCSDAFNDAAGVLNEMFTNIKTVRALTLETKFEERHAMAAIRMLRIGLRRALYCGIFFGISEALIVFTNALIFYYGAVLASSREFTINDILLVFSMLLFSLANLSAIIAFIPQIQVSKDTAARLLHLSTLPTESHEHAGSTRIESVGDITCTNLSFGYSPHVNERILFDVNLRIRAGAATAIVGPSGSGKSTIASLLLRLYATPSSTTPDQPAQLRLGTHDINSLSTTYLRSVIAVVPQNPVLFPTTIGANITYGLTLNSPYSTTDSVRAAANAAGLGDFIASLPAGYDTLVGDGGTGLSGGQAQRLSIARALVRRPRCLILDEATSALDVDSARIVRETVKSLITTTKGMTILIITHDRAMMEVAEWVVMLERGRVVEEGRFDEVSTKRGGKLTELLSGGVWDGGTTDRDELGQLLEYGTEQEGGAGWGDGGGEYTFE